jgi:hypothetical protein
VRHSYLSGEYGAAFSTGMQTGSPHNSSRRSSSTTSTSTKSTNSASTTSITTSGSGSSNSNNNDGNLAWTHSLPPPDLRYLMAVATLKHVTGYSLEDWSPSGTFSDHTFTRQTFDANITAFDLNDTYLPAFQTSIVEGGAAGIM